MVSRPLASIILHFCLCLAYLRLRPVVTIKQKKEKIKHSFDKSHLSFVKGPQQMKTGEAESFQAVNTLTSAK